MRVAGRDDTAVRLVPALRAYGACALVTGLLLARRRLRLPVRNVDRRLAFADGTTSRVYRETVRTGVPTAEPTLLVVQFKLRLIGRSRLMHALFRAESILNTVLFAGFAGFRSKLWATDEHTGVYRGVYEWDGATLARDYATTLAALLRLLSVPGTVRFHVEQGVRRDDFLRDPGIAGGTGGTGHAGGTDAAGEVADQRWWRLREAAAA